ncbi:SoxY-related AACIE arm protein [Microvirga massiliensis]|uniref:SoxY-related AACIE arm protein n=1 Tax=Microvirga massiliensis TaxID=1033741 RepID=UPI00062BDBA0|nr:SoxY-related AACIE arm protein [Microvirga massiliensis]
MTSSSEFRTSRREVLRGGIALVSLALASPAKATPNEMKAAIDAFTSEAAVRPGRIHLDVPPLVENGNSVSVRVRVDSPMTAEDHVKRIAVFNERNPQPHVAQFFLGPRSGRADVATRIRLATSQKVIAVAELSDGSYWSASADVIVTLAACVEG